MVAMALRNATGEDKAFGQGLTSINTLVVAKATIAPQKY
jgi:hypothetical protein